ncbi:MAG: hypothetical protein EZS28_009854 [Streblomastix strix]|uniref:Uncharacterized protein n=1 Tax=Streblomastix strix TaxID=222440 RepID=A0A5J4WHZ6_9EUKA|nr:MAG: hypothetical protein EZS28_009854 [Streblomastix strix]
MGKLNGKKIKNKDAKEKKKIAIKAVGIDQVIVMNSKKMKKTMMNLIILAKKMMMIMKRKTIIKITITVIIAIN